MADEKEGRFTPSFFDRMSNFATPRKPSKASISSVQSANGILPRTDFFYYRGPIKTVKQALAQTTKKKRVLLIKPLRVSFFSSS
jgi:hypothetical protein